MPKTPYDWFVFIIIIQLFYGFSITILSRALVPFSNNIKLPSGIIANYTGMEEIAKETEKALGMQRNIPIIDIGALVYYSGNIVLDMMTNMFFAIPSMATTLITALEIIFAGNSEMFSLLKVFTFTLVSLIYIFMLIKFILALRSRGGIGVI